MAYHLHHEMKTIVMIVSITLLSDVLTINHVYFSGSVSSRSRYNYENESDIELMSQHEACE